MKLTDATANKMNQSGLITPTKEQHQQIIDQGYLYNIVSFLIPFHNFNLMWLNWLYNDSLFYLITTKQISDLNLFHLNFPYLIKLLYPICLAMINFTSHPIILLLVPLIFFYYKSISPINLFKLNK